MMRALSFVTLAEKVITAPLFIFVQCAMSPAPGTTPPTQLAPVLKFPDAVPLQNISAPSAEDNNAITSKTNPVAFGYIFMA